MKLVFTEQAIESLEEVLAFIAPEVSRKKLLVIRDEIIEETESLLQNPFIGQKEFYLEHLNLNHRRIVKGNYKIIYRVLDSYIYITDIFDTRQHPSRMKV